MRKENLVLKFKFIIIIIDKSGYI